MTKYQLVEWDKGRYGIYQFGLYYIVDPSNTMFFPDEVLKLYEYLTKGEK
jgi:hypothetical protein